jgi:hypothetical protein
MRKFLGIFLVAVVLIGVYVKLTHREPHRAVTMTTDHLDAARMIDSGSVRTQWRGYEMFYYRVYELEEDEFRSTSEAIFHRLTDWMDEPWGNWGLDASVYEQVIDMRAVDDCLQGYTTLSSPYTYVFSCEMTDGTFRIVVVY